MTFSSGEFTAGRAQGPTFLMGVNEITLRVYREALWHLERAI